MKKINPSSGTRSHILLLASYADSLLNFRGPLIADLIKAGHTVTVAAPGISKQLANSLAAIGTKVEPTQMARTGLNPFKDIAYYRSLVDLIQRIQPNLVLTYTIKPNIWGAFAAAKTGTHSAAMVTGLGYAFTGKGNFKQRLIRQIATRLYRAATNRNSLVIFQNPDDRDDFIAAGCLADPKKAAMVAPSPGRAPMQVPRIDERSTDLNTPLNSARETVRSSLGASLERTTSVLSPRRPASTWTNTSDRASIPIPMVINEIPSSSWYSPKVRRGVEVTRSSPTLLIRNPNPAAIKPNRIKYQ